MYERGLLATSKGNKAEFILIVVLTNTVKDVREVLSVTMCHFKEKIPLILM